MEYEITLLNKSWYFSKKAKSVELHSWYRLPMRLHSLEYNLNATEFLLINRVVLFFAGKPSATLKIPLSWLRAGGTLTASRLQTGLVRLERLQLLRAKWGGERKKERKKERNSPFGEEEGEGEKPKSSGKSSKDFWKHVEECSREQKL